MRNTSKALPLLALLACLFFAAESRADTFLITGGSATSGTSTGGTFTLTGSGFTLNGGFSQGAHLVCFPCTAGQTANVGLFNLGLDIVSSPNPSVFGGTTYNPLYYSLGTLQFSASIIVPDVADALFTVTTPFTFTATLQGCTDPNGAINSCAPGNTVFNNATFVGQGTATVQLSSIQGENGREYFVRNVRYDFAPAATTPEPATIALLGTGLAGVGAAARRRRRKPAADKLP